MSRRRLSLAGRATVLLLALVAGCAPQATGPVVVAPPVKPPAVAFTDDPRPLPRYHSKRLALSLPLPDGPTWKIDDHSHPELVATHAPTRSKVALLVLHADELVGRNQCEALARDRKLLPREELHTVEDATDITQDYYDTRIWVAVGTGSGPGSPLVGHVMAFGGFLRKCYLFDFSTEVDGASDEPVLSARLAFARARILGGLKLDVLGAVPRETPDVPGAPPALTPNP